MPRRIGQLDLPRSSPHFLACRRAVRTYLSDDLVVVGLSGGPDSLALTAAALAEGVNVCAVVVDHQLQPGSAEVAAQAVAQAELMGAIGRVKTVEVPHQGSLEAQARSVRYQALHQVADGGQVWVGHTADDQAETLLLGALRGNPAGMSPRTGQLIRPFLGIRRADTLGACAELGLIPWQDPHNSNPAFRRVAIRTRVLPLLAEILGGDAADPLAAAAARIAADQEFLEKLAGEPTDDCAELATQPGPLRRRRIAAWLRGRDLRVTAASISAIEALCTDWHGQGGVAVGGEGDRRLEVTRSNGRLTLFQEP
ncbi:tRNA lysidine(34) synthetase TilS [Corynebacterium alimapuense]|uniref:tRNA(Ile)-lysidine synthase n=1 Tax=Corynebacterium alimapuense TaxID=1576874 RepID=A0A3M8KAK1_9CORY|nr:tRNA lysidine(34) synthetase TilS [Corynebacterium alimapuense]RNE49889.1 tRNA lysidine(34) synthetase TilS [Corynebacterium alimapuense]